MNRHHLFVIFIVFILCGCQKGDDLVGDENLSDLAQPGGNAFYYGADLSYINEMEVCGAFYQDLNGQQKDPYQIFRESGANLARIRLWHTPTWTSYSNLDDVKISIQRARDTGMQVLLDFHFSDTWADPANQEIPAAWLSDIDDTTALGALLYQYTYSTLSELFALGLLPEIVQLGNEINPMILQYGELSWPIDWQRNAHLLNQAIAAVRDFSVNENEDVEVMLHIAGPENGMWWFTEAESNGVTNFDWIGLSYYTQWSSLTLEQLEASLVEIKATFNKRIMVVETAYPFTLANVDMANNLLGSDAIVSGFPATQQGQLNFLKALTGIVYRAGGEGVVYWEPAWVSTPCTTPWAQGSSWDNTTLFDHNYKATLGLKFFNSALD